MGVVVLAQGSSSSGRILGVDAAPQKKRSSDTHGCTRRTESFWKKNTKSSEKWTFFSTPVVGSTPQSDVWRGGYFGLVDT
ncbi:hypothetical protein NHX12_026093 [Muraenolepis orangiensis]|uniref:Uncharacterized protein n=1 Tax=Muraenolepis orangiensis TaxID=630683 RepID=A0A9Q0ELJ3_9TELE|nr:hypothetical protein NHX12_026093 [Muraenolepis orangiensis]